MQAAGVSEQEAPCPLKTRGIAALRFYQEIIHLLRPHLSAQYLQTTEPLLDMINAGVKDITISGTKRTA
jgi:hypothetical protein